jgi:hypothetical protein
MEKRENSHLIGGINCAEDDEWMASLSLLSASVCCRRRMQIFQASYTSMVPAAFIFFLAIHTARTNVEHFLSHTAAPTWPQQLLLPFPFQTKRRE